ncbi:MAG: hypothetical protein Q7J77_08125 [Undibacterium sp.]|nr:hypothetical protein [Undibacterium sp.]
MKKIIKIISLVTLMSGIFGLPLLVHASTTVSKTKSTAKTNKVVPAPQVIDEDDAEPNVKQSKNFDYKCELGNSLTMYTNAEDNQHVAMRWKNRIYRMTRIETSTGANRFENRKAGFIFIGIPAKGLLLDSHKGKQLANECKTTEPVLAEAETLIDPLTLTK